MAKRILSCFSVALLVMIFVSCSSLSKKDNVALDGVKSLWVAGDTRDKIIVLSDIHTGFEDAYAEILENRPYLIEFLQRITVTSDVREVVSTETSLMNGSFLSPLSKLTELTSIEKT